MAIIKTRKATHKMINVIFNLSKHKDIVDDLEMIKNDYSISMNQLLIKMIKFFLDHFRVELDRKRIGDEETNKKLLEIDKSIMIMPKNAVKARGKRPVKRRR